MTFEGLRGIPDSASSFRKRKELYPLLGLTSPPEYCQRPPHPDPLDAAGRRWPGSPVPLVEFRPLQHNPGKSGYSHQQLPHCRLRAAPRVSHPLDDRLPAKPSRPLFQAGALMGLTASTC